MDKKDLNKILSQKPVKSTEIITLGYIKELCQEYKKEENREVMQKVEYIDTLLHLHGTLITYDFIIQSREAITFLLAKMFQEQVNSNSNS